MQELTAFSFLAETPQPVLAHEVVEGGRDGMFIRATVSHGAMALDEERACFARGIEAEAVFFAEEVVKGEFGRRKVGI
jgi:hypothetical protein